MSTNNSTASLLALLLLMRGGYSRSERYCDYILAREDLAPVFDYDMQLRDATVVRPRVK